METIVKKEIKLSGVIIKRPGDWSASVALDVGGLLTVPSCILTCGQYNDRNKVVITINPLNNNERCYPEDCPCCSEKSTRIHNAMHGETNNP